MGNTIESLLFRARYVMPMSTSILENGGVVVRDGLIISVGNYPDLKRQFPLAIENELGDVVLMPGLINAHTHLEYTMMKNRLQSEAGFTNWIQDLNKIKFLLREEEIVFAMLEGMKELHQWGCVAAANIVSFPALIEKSPSLPLHLWNFIEMMDIRGPQQGEEGLQIAENFLKQHQQYHADKKIKFGISPHAPQTTSQSLYQASVQLIKKYQAPFCTHLAESEEEFEMFTEGSGMLFDFLKSLGRDMSDTSFQTPVQALLKNDLLPQGALLVHMNCLNNKDRELLTERGKDFFIVHCPKTHRFFDRAPFDWRFFYDHGYRLSVGTDSLASNDELNLFSEMQLFAKTAPDLALEEILKMVTLNPAEALGMKRRLGELCPGAFAEMITIPFGGKKEGVTEAVIQNKNFPKRIF